MIDIRIKELMVPVAQYATIDEDATLYDAVVALEEAQNRYDQSKYVHRALLVFGKNKRIVGKLSQLDMIRGLEPKYDQIVDSSQLSRFGMTKSYLESILKGHELWQKPLSDLCRKAGNIKVKDIMHKPTESEHIDEDATLDRATHVFIAGCHQSLLVTRNGEIVGILRLTDLFDKVSAMVKACAL